VERQQRIQEGDEQSGVGLKGSGGYRYFGVAKNLPGVKELFARNATKLTKRKRGDIYKYITPDYYGLRDEEDGVLLELEESASKSRRQKLEIIRKKYQEEFRCNNEEESDNELEAVGGVTGGIDAVTAHVSVPIQDLVAKTLLEKKKKELLASLS